MVTPALTAAARSIPATRASYGIPACEALLSLLPVQAMHPRVAATAKPIKCFSRSVRCSETNVAKKRANNSEPTEVYNKLE
jgi:hypothetical protein